MIVNKLTVSDPDFPKILAQIPSPPRQIYWAGQPPKLWLAKPRVAIVGSRKLTVYGKSVTSKLAGELANAGVVIISGLAYGIDITAHQAALEVGGITVAVLPSSLDKIYPSAHINIARQILETGTLISEYPEGADIAFKSNFIARNRLVSGLADVLLIPEAAVNSGSLHTARFALEQGKTVMAVPGNINSLVSEGCNNLIKSGAIPVTEVSDVFFALKLNPAQTKTTRGFTGSEQEETVYRLIQHGVVAQEQLAIAAQMDSPVLSSTLTMLEIGGYIRPAGGGNWLIT
jgi:DNA processing protein